MAGELAAQTFGFNISLIFMIASFVGIVIMYFFNRFGLVHLSDEGILLTLTCIFVVIFVITLFTLPAYGIQMAKLSV